MDIGAVQHDDGSLTPRAGRIVQFSDDHRGGIVILADLADAAREAGADPLTDRERDVLRLAEEGMPNRDIGDHLGLSPGTVRNYLSEAASKLYAANRIEAVRVARARGWL